MKFRISLSALLNTEIVALRTPSDEIIKQIKILESENQNEVLDIDLDFSDIKFISRSFAHSLICIRNESNPSYNISFINVIDEVNLMLSTVESNLTQKYYDCPREELIPEASASRNFFRDCTNDTKVGLRIC